MNRGKAINIKKTYIIEPLLYSGSTPIFSACTKIYTNLVESCSGDTSISLGLGVVDINSNLTVDGNISAAIIEATQILSGGTNILDIIYDNNIYISGASFSNGSLFLNRNDGFDIVVTGFTDTFTTGATVKDNIIYFDTNQQMSAYTIDLSSVVISGISFDTYISGSTTNGYDTFFERSDNQKVKLSGTTSLFSNDIVNTGNTWVRLTDQQILTFKDKWLSPNTIKILGVRGRNNNNNLFFRYEDSTPYNTNPYYVYSDLIISDVVISDNSNSNWSGVILTGTSLIDDILFSIQINGEGFKILNNLNITVPTNTKLYLYMSGNNVSYPKMEVYLRNIEI
jgi:hypothetical protein